MRRRSQQSKGYFSQMGRALDIGVERARETLPDMREPVGVAVEAGRGALREALRGAMPDEPRRRRRTRRSVKSVRPVKDAKPRRRKA